ncbi:polysaccharide biosynthesis protein [Pseudonocardia humida]|uniref:Polysaccharide biosynthesis protein n=1 Tax=Pseudonocardia humida TaxID=2800819 RepID=A0ABT0ZZM2_9PSEU|nr:polysaccharide biosynthesis protein [Pseudonocardia humida]MCO1656171.1 polysaccharide biosynthesis protein [Pseudonocardia humida]
MTAATAVPPATRTGAVATLAVSLALIGANALAYGFTVLAARTLTPASYGELAALLGVLLVAVVPANGLQTAGALAMAGSRAGVGPRELHSAGLVTAAAVAALAALAAPLVGVLLHLPDPRTALWLAVLLVPHLVVGAHLGILQGTERFARLAAVTVAFTGAKTAGAVIGLLVAGTPAGALAGMTAGALAGALVGWLGCGAPRPGPGWRPPAVAGLSAAAALLGFVLLSGLDVLLARHWLSAGAAGEYAVGAIIVKVVFWLPQGVGVVLLPRLADPADRRRALLAALGVVGGLGAVLTLGTAAVGARALPLIGGAAYGSGIGGAAWVFAALGTLLALAQLLLYSGIAAADRVPGGAVWLAVGAETAAVAGLAAAGWLSPTTVAVAAAAVVAALVVTGLLRHARGTRRPGAGR